MYLGLPSNTLLCTKQIFMPLQSLLITDKFHVARELPPRMEQMEQSPQQSSGAEVRSGRQRSAAPLWDTQALWGARAIYGVWATFHSHLWRLELNKIVPKQGTNYLQVSV